MEGDLNIYKGASEEVKDLLFPLAKSNEEISSCNLSINSLKNP